MAEKKQIFTPSGGMNTDDSLITPAQDSAGRSLFGQGDYRYALNARIGSSRSDNFGDLENIKSTTECETYLTKQVLNTNPGFDGTLSPWLQLADGVQSWAWNSAGGTGAARVTRSGVGALNSNTLYQAVSLAGDSIKLSYYVALISGSFTSGYALKIIFLNGLTQIGEQTLQSGSVKTGGKLITITDIPDNTDGIGIKVIGNTTGTFVMHLFRAIMSGWAPATVPVGTEKVIGRLEDKEFLKLYYAVYNSNGNHTIRMYDYATDSVFELLRWSGLNFLETYFVKLAKLDNWLAFTDRNNAPRLIDVDTITDLSIDLATDFREFHISFHKWAPSAPPIPRVYYDGATNNWEKLKNKTRQFSHRYIYNGDLKSRWSPISKSAVTPGRTGDFYAAKTITSIEVEIRGSILDLPGQSVQYNYFDHTDIKFVRAVKCIEVAFREGELDVWRLWKRILPENDAFATLHYFDGKFDGRPVSLSDFNQPFDTVPFLAGTVEAIDNRFVFGDCLDELDPMEGFRVDDVGTSTDPANDWRDSFPSSFSQFTTTVKNKLLRLNALSNFNFKARGQYNVGIIFQHHTGYKSLAYTNDDLTYEAGATAPYRLHAFKFTIPANVKPPSWATSYQIVRTNALNIDYFMIGMANKFYPLLDNPNQLTGLTNLPDSVKNRINNAFANTNLVNGYEVAAEIEKAQDLRGANSIGEIVGHLKGTIDKDSYHDDVLDIKSKGKPSVKEAIMNIGGGSSSLMDAMKKFPQISSLLNELRTTKTESVLGNSARMYIDLNNWYNAAKQSPTKDRPISKLYYNFRQGDRVRFWGSTMLTPATSADLIIYDVEILEFTGTGLIIEKPEGILSIPSEVSPWNTSGFQIEVYTPKISGTSDYIFYEVGEWYPVLYPGTDDRDFSKKDWNYTSNAAVTLSQYGPFDIFHKMPLFYADCFNISKPLLYRDLSPLSNGVGTSMNPDPSYTFAYWDRNAGRPSIAYLDLPVSKFKPTMARFGGKIVEESSINALNRFRFEDNFIYPSEYGRIRDLINTSNAQVESVGSILLAIGEREAWSIYVNRTTLEDLSGNTQVSLSDKVLGSYNTLLGSHGTLNPESISFERGRVYWWNALSGDWVRYGRDGITEISSYKMRNWFRDLSILLATQYATDDLPRVISGYDIYNEELVTSFIHSSLPATFRGYANYKGAMFSEEDVRWKSIHTWDPEFFGKVGTMLVSFKAARLFKHEQGEDYSSFYGTKKDVYIEPVFNQESLNVKSWQDIANTVTHGWSVERILSEYRGPETKQESRIPLTSFEPKEDTYYAAFKNDLNTPNVADPIVNGKKMRSKAIQVLMKLDPAVVTLSLLHYVTVGSIDSPKNPVNL